MNLTCHTADPKRASRSHERTASLSRQSNDAASDAFFRRRDPKPHEHHGTFPLPESQLDRFMMRLTIGYPDTASEKAILAMGMEHDAVRHLETRMSPVELLKWMDQVRLVHVAAVVDDYLLSIVQATRTAERVEVGVSPRGAIALRKASQARALLQNRDRCHPRRY